MKKLFAVALMAAVLTFAGNAKAESLQEQLAISIAQVTPLDLINWKVGDTANYNMSMGFFGKGTSTKSVTKEEGRAIWVRQVMAIMGQNQTADILINREDGKILKMIVNGQEQQVPNDKIEIISQEVTEITVPAGKFKAIHITAKSEQAPKIELWANPQATVMDGALKQIMATNMGIEITLELTSFAKGN